MRRSLILFYCVFMVLFLGVTVFTGRNILAVLLLVSPQFSATAVWSVLLPLAVLLPVARLFSWRYAGVCCAGAVMLGSYAVGVIYWLFCMFVLADCVRAASEWFGVLPQGWLDSPIYGFVWMGLALAVVCRGLWQARYHQVCRYDIRINKAAGGRQTLHVALVSDIHLGPVVGKQRLRELVAAIQALQPDLVLLAGDIIDDDVVYVAKHRLAELFAEIKPPLGVFAVFGNHEHRGGAVTRATPLLTAAGVKVLRDECVVVQDSLVIAGREDAMVHQFTGQRRKPLAEVLQGIDKRLPVLVLDHQPVRLAEPADSGVDLQVSGHTHKGQMFPANYVTRRFFEQDWGYLRKGDFQLIVSSGYGTCGTPLRLGSRSELVDIRIQFGGADGSGDK